MESPQWYTRPLPIEMETAAVKNSLFLLQLREKMYGEIGRLFCQYFYVFLGVLRDSNYTYPSDYQV